MKADRLLVVVVLVTMLVLCGCAQNDSNGDAEFLKWMKADTEYQQGTNAHLVNELELYEWYNLKVTAEEAEDYVNTISIPKCDSFTVSKGYTALRDEYHEYLSDVGLFYSYMKSLGRSGLDDQLDEATEAFNNASDYMARANTHMNRLNELAEGLHQENP